ncbi:hypothetical protein PG985_008027 [Apiospora marii]|uniref:Uncharacterized protein n=1 Tax=Apiospora marii TaxID=335849 RepID=A0ABR1R9C1_9PEZI
MAENPGIRRLAVRNLVLVKSATWSKPAWRAFLSRLVTLELGLWADQPAVDRGAYQSFQYHQLRHFHGPLSSEPAALRRFALLAALSSYRRDCPMHGNENDAGAAPLALPPPPYLWTAPGDCMPRLSELRVENCVVDAGLAAFIVERGRCSLRTVELVDCVALVDDMNAVVEFSWEAFFDATLAALTGGGGGDPQSEIVALKEFVLRRTRPVALIDEGRWRGTGTGHHSLLEAEEDERRRAGRVRDRVRGLRLQGGGGRAFNEAKVLFPYVALPGMGPSVEQEGFNLLRAEDGGDAAACRRLMEAVRANRDRRVAGQ